MSDSKRHPTLRVTMQRVGAHVPDADRYLLVDGCEAARLGYTGLNGGWCILSGGLGALEPVAEHRYPTLRALKSACVAALRGDS